MTSQYKDVGILSSLNLTPSITSVPVTSSSKKPKRPAYQNVPHY